MKRMISLVLSLVLLISLAGCSTSPSTAADTHVIIDQDGFEVTVPKQIDRIVVCDILPLPSVLAVFFDSAEKIVGISGTSMNAAENSLLGELYPEILDAETGFIDDVIEADSTRPRVAAAFEMLFSKSEEAPSKKHGSFRF